MGLDKLGILFIIIILPIALVLNTYTNTQVETLKMQLDYDTKLNNATYDAVKTYQINSLNEDASNLGDVRIGNINAAVNVFFTSLASNLNMAGYSKQFLQEYVPALVFTMYDGYYIYSKYTNTLEESDYATQADANTNGMDYASAYQGGEQLYGLKPFVHYSCRYAGNYKGNKFDIVISYTLDNYITIQGIIGDKPVDKSGYLIDISDSDKTYYDSINDKVYYRGIEITKENILKDNLVLNGKDNMIMREEDDLYYYCKGQKFGPYNNVPSDELVFDSENQTKAYPYHKVNGVKYYWNNFCWFTMLNGDYNPTNYDFDTDTDDSAFNYYKEAITFSDWVNKNISPLTSKFADVEYKVYDENNNEIDKVGITKNDNKIFEMKGIEEPDSNFNVHRREVIKYTIEKNLSIAIANYNTYNKTTGFEFRMPKFGAEEWDRIQNNMTVISYLQGLPIGTKIYNGVSVIANNVNEEVVAEDSIFIGDGGNTTNSNDPGNNYYPVTYKDYSSISNPIGIYNVDLQRRQVEYNKQTFYYYPKLYFNVYSSQRKTVELYATEKTEDKFNGNLYKYLDSLSITSNVEGRKLAKAFYTALGREKKSRYNQRNNYNNLLSERTFETGDLNGDKKIDYYDFIMLSTYVNQGNNIVMSFFSDEQMKAADTNNDTNIDSDDLAFYQGKI